MAEPLCLCRRCTLERLLGSIGIEVGEGEQFEIELLDDAANSVAAAVGIFASIVLVFVSDEAFEAWVATLRYARARQGEWRFPVATGEDAKH